MDLTKETIKVYQKQIKELEQEVIKENWDKRWKIDYWKSGHPIYDHWNKRK